MARTNRRPLEASHLRSEQHLDAFEPGEIDVFCHTHVRDRNGRDMREFSEMRPRSDVMCR